MILFKQRKFVGCWRCFTIQSENRLMTGRSSLTGRATSRWFQIIFFVIGIVSLRNGFTAVILRELIIIFFDFNGYYLGEKWREIEMKTDH